MYSIDGLEYGRHIIKLVPTGQKNELSKSADVQIDYAKVLGYVDSGEIEASKYTEVEEFHIQLVVMNCLRFSILEIG